MTDLFGNTETTNMKDAIRTLGFYQPFGSLMFHGKIETRWVMKGRKPPFPLGRYAFYTTRKWCDNKTLIEWCGNEIASNIKSILKNDVTKNMDETLLGYGDLIKFYPMSEVDEQKCFVKYAGEREFEVSGKNVIKKQWCLLFDNVIRIHPIRYFFNGKSLGKQGIGFLHPEFEKYFK